mmetsp:Transcript_10008/g.20807  ORF Transcript_10008/g.20807 Transcript_10008/m.20807 type:complete len:428 (-) Transcript_10008:23-1306(-)
MPPKTGMSAFRRSSASTSSVLMRSWRFVNLSNNLYYFGSQYSNKTFVRTSSSLMCTPSSASLNSIVVTPSSCRFYGFCRSNLPHRVYSPSLFRQSTMHQNRSRNNFYHVQKRSFSSSSNKNPKQSPNPPQPEPQFQAQETSSFFQNLSKEIIYLLRDLQLFLPRILACASTLYLFSEYGFKTIPCEGPSMEPTIMDGRNTVVLLERWSHRIFGLEERRPPCLRGEGEGSESEEFEQTGANLKNQSRCSKDATNSISSSWYNLFRGIWEQHFRSGLQRGDVIILRHPEREGTICKRIIGMPGDTIVRNDSRKFYGNSGKEKEKVPQGHIWIEGDNAPQSHDSRYYGPVPASLVIGKVICRLWPLRDYEWMDKDANGRDIFRRIDGRIGRRVRWHHSPGEGGRYEGSYVLNDLERGCRKKKYYDKDNKR